METILREKQASLVDLDKKFRQLEDEKTKLQSEHTVALAKKTDEIKALQAQRDQLDATYQTSVAAITKTKSDLAADITKAQTTLKSVQDSSKKETEGLKTKVQTLTRDNIALVRKTNELTATPVRQTPDGEVTFVNQRGRSVWINRGEADGLQRGVTFSVLDKNTTSVEGSKPKGSIEITRLVEPHLAEATILSDDLTNPILDGDLIYSPTWQPGTKIHFAMVGFMDYNNDGKDDSALVKNVITLNNGVIDAHVTATGKKTGTVNVNTRYLVVGDRPNDKSDANALTQYTNMIGAAERLGIEQISVQKLLSSMGVKTSARTVGQTRGAGSAATTPAKSGGGGFRPRTPPARGAGGAF